MALVSIVVADDDPEIRELVSDVLEEAGYRVHAVGDGLSALIAIRSGAPALALLDIAMPVMTGDEVLKTLRAEGATLPIVVMTASTNPQQYLQLAATAVLPKPFELSRLLALIVEALTPPSLLRETALGAPQPRSHYEPR